MSVLRRRDAAAAAGEFAVQVDGGRFGVQFPGIWEHLSSLVGPDGGRRVPSTITLFCDDGGVKVCLNDRDQGLTGWAAGESVDACLMALERGLQGDSVEWRAALGAKKKKR